MGVNPGRTLAAARARAGDLESRIENLLQLTEAKTEVVRRLIAVSPRIAPDGATRLWVEPLGKRRSELHAWCTRVRAVLGGFGPVSIGLGPTATVAWAASVLADDEDRIVSASEASAFLDQAPVEVLELGSEALDILASLGIRQVGQLRNLSSTALGMRFGPVVADARRRIDGFDPRGPQKAELKQEYEVRADFDDELEELAPLLFLLRPAADALTARMRSRGLGLSHGRLVLRLRGRLEETIELRAASPIAHGNTLFDLIRTRLDHACLDHACLDHAFLRAPLTGFCLVAETTSPFQRNDPRLFERTRSSPADREVTVERLRSRLGEENVARARRSEVGPLPSRASFTSVVDDAQSARGESLPWHRVEPPVRVSRGRVLLLGRARSILRMGRVERASAPWWEGGRSKVELFAWAELDGPLLALVRARCDTACDDLWEVVAFCD